MKRLAIAVVCALLVSVPSVFADDAKVLPAGVLRTTIAPTYAFQNGSYDVDGKFVKDQENDRSFKLFNLGFALEYGVTDAITAAVQWAPGWNVWSDVDLNAGTSTYNVNGLWDLFAGAKFQLVGTSGLAAKSDAVRLAIAPGVKIPLPGTDFDEQTKNSSNGDPVTIADIDKHTWGLGARFYADYAFTDVFFINLFGEYIYFLEQKNGRPRISAPEADYNYGYSLKVELEPHYDVAIADKTTLSFGLPVTYSATPDYKVDGTTATDSATSLVSISPNMSLFLKGAGIPTELKLGYSMPLTGVNTPATHSITLQIKNYLKF